MKKSLISLLAAGMMFSLSHQAMAGDQDTAEVGTDGSVGAYVNVDFGYAWIGDQTVITAPRVGVPAANVTTNGSGFGWMADVGYQINDYIALEIGYIGLPDSNSTGVSLFRDLYGLYLAGKAIFQINELFNVYGKAGLARMAGTQGPLAQPQEVGANTTGFTNPDLVEYTGIFALGAGYNITRNITVNLQGTTTLKSNPMPASYLLTLGLGYKFAL